MKKTYRSIRSWLAASALLAAFAVQAQTINLVPIGTYATGIYDEGASEVVDYDASTQRVYSTNALANSVDILDVSDPTNPVLFSSINLAPYGGGVNSVTVLNGGIAVAVEAMVKQDPGSIVFFDLAGTFLSQVTVGALPDMVTATPDKLTVLVANEGEPSDDYLTDPIGSVSIIDVSGGLATVTAADVTTLDFSSFSLATVPGARVFGPGASFAQDMEPEHIAVAPDGNTAWVVCQENNVVGRIDLTTNTWVSLTALGTVDHSVPGNGIDASNQDGTINIATWPVKGFFMPDGMDAYEVGGNTYVVFANEGDSRDYGGFSEESRVSGLTLDPVAFPNAATLQQNSQLGRLNITTTAGDLGNDGDYEELYSYGSRSFSIRDAAGNLVFDSGDQFEQLIATVLPSEFNSTNSSNGSFDSRSDDKGPEPEAIEIAEIGGQFYAFIGLERISGIMVYNVTDPVNPVFVQYVNNRDFSGDVSLGTAKDAGVETLKFIPATNSPNGKDLLVSGNEISGTVTLFEINVPAPNFTLQLLHASDLEGGVEAIGNAPNFAAIMDALEDSVPNTVRLSAGDNYIPGPFFNAASNRTVMDPVLRGIYNYIFGAGTSDFLRSAEGRADITIMNILAFDASAIGNHEFDAGTDIARAIWGTEPNGGGNRWLGTQFPYLSANLDFSGDGNLSGIYSPVIVPNTNYITPPNTVVGGEPKIAPATTILRGGELIGVVGATTQVLESITSNGGVSVVGPTSNDMPALAAILQPVIDQLTNNGVNKIILVTHLQQFALEQQLIGLLSGVDIIVAGGSDAILADGDDVLRPGDVADGPYPFLTTNLDGDPAVLVSTDGEYSYVGRLVVDFDANGILQTGSIDPLQNGPVSTTDASVTALWGDLVTPFALGTKGELVQRITNAIEGIVIAQDGNVFGKTDVFLEGRREFVRTEETNLGNFTSDANLFYAQTADAATAVSLKNGGGIRAAIGEVVETSPGVYDLLPPQANPLSGKLEGEVSQLDIANSLRFNNALSLVTLTPGQLLQVLDHGVAAWAPGATPGQMCQIGGMAFSFDPALPAGSRVRNAVVKDLNGNTTDTIAIDGSVHGDPARPIRMVTLSFLADGGDSYPFPTFATADPVFYDRVDLATATQTGVATFANDGTEQDAFAEYLAANFSSTPFNEADTPIDQDERIQNLSFRGDAIFGPGGFAPQLIASQCGRMDFLAGDFLISGLDPAVTAEFGVGDNSDDGYQFRFTDPNGPYVRNVFYSHANPTTGAPSGPSAAAHVRFQNLQTNPIPLDVLLNVEVRSRVNGVNGPWGTPCEIMVLSAPPACPVTELVDNVNNPNFSCGVTRSFGGSDRIVANPVVGATNYRFRFDDGQGFVRNIAGTSRVRILNWSTLPLVDGATYDVTVAVSLDGGATYCPFGPACQVTIDNAPAAASLRDAAAGVPAATIWPNPNNGDLLRVRIEGLDVSASLANVEIMDLTGKVVSARGLAVSGGVLEATIDLNGTVSRGMYLVRISAGDRSITERLMID